MSVRMNCHVGGRLSQEIAAQRFAVKRLTLLSQYKNNYTKVEVRCYCEKIFRVFPKLIFQDNIVSCGCYRKQMKRKDISNQRFGKLIALRPKLSPKGGMTIWECLCDCGSTSAVPINNLTSGHTKSCGCNKRRIGGANPHWKGHGGISLARWNVIVRSAKDRRLPFRVSLEDCWNLFTAQDGKCALSGVRLTFAESSNSRSDASASLDRIDPQGGYVAGNIQWIHKTLNKMKGKFSQVRFIELCKLVARPIERTVVSSHCNIGPKHQHFRGFANIGAKKWNRLISGTDLGRDRRLRRNISFNLGVEDAWKRFVEQRGWCVLTGLEIDWASYSGMTERGTQRCSGGSASLDRIDNSRGYEPGNIQWVHKDVNCMKWDLTTEELKYWCQRVARFRMITQAATITKP